MSVTILLPLDDIAAVVASQVRIELAPELATLDVAVSTRATPADVDVTVSPGITPDVRSS